MYQRKDNRKSVFTSYAPVIRRSLIVNCCGHICLLFGLSLSLSTAYAEPTRDDSITAHQCQRIANKLASVAYNECLERGLISSSGSSVKGAPILHKEYPPLARRKPLGRVLLLGGIHGDEYSSVSVVFKWMKILDKFHSGMFHWHIAPLVNPDGLLQKKSQRMNANNVDLNRNFPMRDWKTATNDYWVNKTHRNPRRYPGQRALSEPESNWLVEEIETFRPDVIVSIHAPHGIVDYDGPKDAPYKLGRLYLQLVGTYPGSLGNYAGIQKQIPVVTIELPYAGIMPTASEISHIWRDLISWLSKNIQLKHLTTAEVQETEPS